MGSGSTEAAVFFICDGKVPECSKKSCFYKTNNVYDCMHTTNLSHALNFDHGRRNRPDRFWEKPPEIIRRLKAM